ncbi:MAG: prephenate dehydrogenase/arogenate dehydrogenase family protein [Spirochaetales bacterium]|nr:prephenate dehydrogenase/arogenate dehydrogenase family protein [Spirochaetales bacterium]
MNVGVYGLGRFGRFWASLLAKRHQVTVYNRSPGREVPPGVRQASLEELMANNDTVFLCCAISAMEPVLNELCPLARPGQVIADTCSVKVVPARQMLSILPPEVSLLATHPMFGPDSARQGLNGLPLVLHNLRGAWESFSFWKRDFSEQGLSVIDMTPDEHDKAAAYTQGVTHFIGRVLSDMHLTDHPIATQGYKKLLDIVQQTCNDPFQLFLDLQTYNPYTSEMRDDLKRSLNRILDRLSGSLDSVSERR